MANFRAADDGEVFSGWLTKRAGSKDDWRVRWFLLKELRNAKNPSYSLAYYKNKKKRGVKQVPKGAISLTWDSEVIPQTDIPGHKNVFTVQGQDQGRSYLISAKSRADMVTWINNIQQCIERVADYEGKEPKARGLFALPEDELAKQKHPPSPRSPRDKHKGSLTPKKSPRKKVGGSIGRRKGKGLSPRRRPSSAVSPRRKGPHESDQPFPGISVREEAFPGVPIRTAAPAVASAGAAPHLNLSVVRDNSLRPEADWAVIESLSDEEDQPPVENGKSEQYIQGEDEDEEEEDNNDDDVYNQPFNFSGEEEESEPIAEPTPPTTATANTKRPTLDLTLNLAQPRKPLPPPPDDDQDDDEVLQRELENPLLEFLKMYGLMDVYSRLAEQDMDLETLMMLDVADLRRLNLEERQARILCEALDLSFDQYRTVMRRSTAPGTKLRNLLISAQAAQYFDVLFPLIDYRSLTLMGEKDLREFDLPEDVLDRLFSKIQELQSK